MTATIEAIVEFHQDSHRAELSQLLVAADASVVRVCCEHAGDDGLRVSQHVETARAYDRVDRVGVFVREGDVVETDPRRIQEPRGLPQQFVCATHKPAPSPVVLPLAARLARQHGLTVISSEPHAGRGSRLERLVNPILRRRRD